VAIRIQIQKFLVNTLLVFAIWQHCNARGIKDIRGDCPAWQISLISFYYYFITSSDFFVGPTSTKPVGINIEVRKMSNQCNSSSLNDHGVLVENCIPSLKSYRDALEQSGFHGVFCDCSDASTNLLYQLCDHLMPHTSCFHCKGIECVYCSVWHTCLSSSVLLCGLPRLVWSLCWQCWDSA